MNEVISNVNIHVPSGIVRLEGHISPKKLNDVIEGMRETGSPILKITGDNIKDDLSVIWEQEYGWHSKQKLQNQVLPKIVRVFDEQNNYGFGYLTGKSEDKAFVCFPNDGASFVISVDADKVKTLPSNIEAKVYNQFKGDDGRYEEDDYVIVNITKQVLALSPDEIAQLADENGEIAREIIEDAGFDQPFRAEIISSLARYFNHNESHFNRYQAPPHINDFSVKQNRDIQSEMIKILQGEFDFDANNDNLDGKLPSLG